MAKKPKISWHEIEREYRIGKKTNVRIAEEFGVSESAIRRRAKKEGWTRDLKGQIKERADRIVQQKAIERLAIKEIETDERTVDENAQLMASVRLAHRKDINESRMIAMTLLSDLKSQIGTDNKYRLDSLIQSALDNSADPEALDQAISRAISLPSHVRVMKDLADTMSKLVALERQAWGLDDVDTSPVDALTELLHSISRSNNNAFSVVKEDPEYNKQSSNSIGVSADDDSA